MIGQPNVKSGRSLIKLSYCRRGGGGRWSMSGKAFVGQCWVYASTAGVCLREVEGKRMLIFMWCFGIRGGGEGAHWSMSVRVLIGLVSVKEFRGFVRWGQGAHWSISRKGRQAR